MNWLKQNWFKVSFLFIVLFGFYLLSAGNQKQGSENQTAVLTTPLETNIPPDSSDNEFLNAETARIVSIIDGDTVKLSTGQIVRLIGIDAPEGNEPFYSESKNKLSDLILNKEVRLEKDISEVDRYSRPLRYIFIDDILVNLEIVRQGYATAYKYPPDVKYYELLSQAESEARSEFIGMWSKTATPAPTEQTIPFQSSFYLPPCTSSDCDCANFSSHAHAQWFHENHDPYDNHRLDRDGDGLACESLP